MTGLGWWELILFALIAFMGLGGLATLFFVVFFAVRLGSRNKGPKD